MDSKLPVTAADFIKNCRTRSNCTPNRMCRWPKLTRVWDINVLILEEHSKMMTDRQIVSSLAKEGQPGKFRGVPYEESCLTHFLQESLGRNAKLTVICNFSPDNRNDNETLRTLRFGHRIRSIQNKLVIDEISEDDVNDLSDHIRQLKEEIIRAK